MDPERQNEEIEVADQPDNYSLEEGKVDEEEPPIEAGEFDQQPQVGAAADVGIRRSREFPRRQVQMMALGTISNCDSHFRYFYWDRTFI